MESHIIEIEFINKFNDKPPQLGITVEAHRISTKQTIPKDTYRNHDYQNFDLITNNANNSDNANNNNHKQDNHAKVKTTTTTANANSREYHNLEQIHPHNNNNNHINNHQHQHQQQPHHHHHYEEKKPSLGLQILEIQQGSIIDLNGQFKIGDVIVEVNGVDLHNLSFTAAQQTLKSFVTEQSSSHGTLSLKILRTSSSSSSTNSPSSSNNKAQHVVEAANYSRRMGTKHKICLSKSKDGFGIKIAERDNIFGLNKPKIYITAITTHGSAYQDGRLKEGDMLLEVNRKNLAGVSQPELTKMLKSIRVGEVVEFVVSRQDYNLDQDRDQPLELDQNQQQQKHSNQEKITNDNDRSLIDLQTFSSDDPIKTDNHQLERRIDSILNIPKIDGPGEYIYNIPLNDTKSAGLGLSLKYPTLDGKDLGIWISNVLTGGAAFKDGRLQPNDQILAINGINLRGLTNSEAKETLTVAVSRGIGPEATSNTIRLHIHRRNSADIARILHGADNNVEQNTDIPAKDNTRDHTMSQTIEPASSLQSWEDDSMDNATGEERFQRDGFGRQSMSEKRHAQMMAQNTDTFKRNQKIQEERELEKQRQMIKQFSFNRKVNDSFRAAVNPSYEISVDPEIPVSQPTNDYAINQMARSHDNNIHQLHNHRDHIPSQYPSQPLQLPMQNHHLHHQQQLPVQQSHHQQQPQPQHRSQHQLHQYHPQYQNQNHNHHHHSQHQLMNVPTTSSKSMSTTMTNNTTVKSNINSHDNDKNNNNNSICNNNQPKKSSSSIFSKFLKFGSMKREKKKNTNSHQPVIDNSQQIESETNNKQKIHHHNPRLVHSRTHSSMSHLNPHSNPSPQQFINKTSDLYVIPQNQNNLTVPKVIPFQQPTNIYSNNTATSNNYSLTPSHDYPATPTNNYSTTPLNNNNIHLQLNNQLSNGLQAQQPQPQQQYQMNNNYSMCQQHHNSLPCTNWPIQNQMHPIYQPQRQQQHPLWQQPNVVSGYATTPHNHNHNQNQQYNMPNQNAPMDSTWLNPQLQRYSYMSPSTIQNSSLNNGGLHQYNGVVNVPNSATGILQHQRNSMQQTHQPQQQSFVYNENIPMNPINPIYGVVSNGCQNLPQPAAAPMPIPNSYIQSWKG